MTESVHSFARLSAINVSEHIEKKGGFSYLSWPYAVSQLRLADGNAVWEVRRFNGLPYLATEAGVFVEVAVTVQGITPIADPSRPRWTEPADTCSHGVRHQHVDPAMPGEGNRASRTGAVHLCRRRPAAGANHRCRGCKRRRWAGTCRGEEPQQRAASSEEFTRSDHHQGAAGPDPQGGNRSRHLARSCPRVLRCLRTAPHRHDRFPASDPLAGEPARRLMAAPTRACARGPDTDKTDKTDKTHPSLWSAS
jgi:hypothetical protein